MAYQQAVNAVALAFGTATSVAAASTSTTDPIPMPAVDYTVQVTAIATGTSGVGATVIWQGSNDRLAWVPISSATTTATQAGVSTTYAAAAMAVGQTRFAYGRAATVVVTGTGAATVMLGA